MHTDITTATSAEKIPVILHPVSIDKNSVRIYAGTLECDGIPP